MFSYFLEHSSRFAFLYLYCSSFFHTFPVYVARRRRPFKIHSCWLTLVDWIRCESESKSSSDAIYSWQFSSSLIKKVFLYTTICISRKDYLFSFIPSLPSILGSPLCAGKIRPHLCWFYFHSKKLSG